MEGRKKFYIFAYLNHQIDNDRKGENNMTLKEKQLEFIIYCVESTAERLGRYGSDVYNKLKELGAIEGYITNFYDTLHTQGKSIL
nr:DUF3791 domain-containing protein [uncultured Bacteroides sp.]